MDTTPAIGINSYANDVVTAMNNWLKYSQYTVNLNEITTHTKNPTTYRITLTITSSNNSSQEKPVYESPTARTHIKTTSDSGDETIIIEYQNTTPECIHIIGSPETWNKFYTEKHAHEAVGLLLEPKQA